MDCNEVSYEYFILLTTIGAIATVASTVSHLPLLYKSFISKKALDQLSKKTLITAIFAHALWCIYGVLRWDFVLIISGGFAFLIESTLLILKLCRHTNSKQEFNKSAQTNLSFVDSKQLHI
tara:strand:+ start:3169 stop:3531 length:363 start_codon:yes stop_codon:yes gene_type:complete